MHQWVVLKKKNNIKIYIKTAPDMFLCYSYTIIGERINLCLLKLQLLKQSIKIHRRVWCARSQMMA